MAVVRGCATVPRMAEQQTRAPRRQTLWILWGGFVAAVLVYGLVVVMAVEHGQQSAGAPPFLRLVFTAAALVLAGASIWWRRRVTGQTQFMPATEKQSASYDAFQTNCVLTWALSEAVGVLGLLLGLLSRDLGAFLPFAAGAVMLLITHRPDVWPQWSSLDE